VAMSLCQYVLARAELLELMLAASIAARSFSYITAAGVWPHYMRSMTASGSGMCRDRGVSQRAYSHW
jgi:hypothetical protein